MSSVEMRELLEFLGSRYTHARRELDEIRVRALELVVAACVTDVRAAASREPEPAPVLSEESTISVPSVSEPPVPPSVPEEPTPTEEESAAAFWAELEAEGEEQEEPEPEEQTERGPAVDREPASDVGHPTGPLVWPPAGGEDVHEEPVRGSWERPDADPEEPPTG
jgi:hypothetical protein